MIIREVTIGELEDFITSEAYNTLSPKPISRPRAISQAKNPSGNPNDIALVYMAENQKLIAFAGILPDELADDSEPVYSNSGWWVHPELGRKYGLSVFFKAFQRCNQRMFLTDCTEYTKSILEKTGLFSFRQPLIGQRFILRSYSGVYFKRKAKNVFLSGFFTGIDFLVNTISSFRMAAWRRKFLPVGYTVHFENTIDEELNQFIQNHSSNYFLKQDGDKINWIRQNKWLTEQKDHPDENYPFSLYTNSFRQEFMVISKNGKTVALLFVNHRDNHVSIPYAYFNDDFILEVLILFIDYLMKLKADSLVVFNPKILNVLDQIHVPAIKSLRLIRYSGYSYTIKNLFSEERTFQDGEGDVAFT